MADAAPDHTPALIDVAELSLETGRLDEAAAAFQRIREADELPDHEVHALHGMILVELRRGDSARALELAREAAAVDRVGRTAGVLAFLEAGESGAEAEEPPPSAEEVEAMLSASLSEHRRLHA